MWPQFRPPELTCNTPIRPGPCSRNRRAPRRYCHELCHRKRRYQEFLPNPRPQIRRLAIGARHSCCGRGGRLRPNSESFRSSATVRDSTATSLRGGSGRGRHLLRPRLRLAKRSKVAHVHCPLCLAQIQVVTFAGDFG